MSQNKGNVSKLITHTRSHPLAGIEDATPEIVNRVIKQLYKKPPKTMPKDLAIERLKKLAGELK